jgi:hypothetical protein
VRTLSISATLVGHKKRLRKAETARQLIWLVARKFHAGILLPVAYTLLERLYVSRFPDDAKDVAEAGLALAANEYNEFFSHPWLSKPRGMPLMQLVEKGSPAHLVALREMKL